MDQPVSDKHIQRRRSVVEGCFDRVGQWRGTATRHYRTAGSFRAVVTSAALPMWP
ncbi:hypothetical protein [Actinomadura keratinilytica]|uniref:hypothetical protein n=1 Tax=Actinomadura keratinilytica TaxID=547461 RepID=UPI0031EF4E4B